MMKRTSVISLSMLLLGAAGWWSAPSFGMQNQVAREQDITNLQLGQRIKVDDGTCPVGQIKEIMGARMSPAGVVRTRKCVPRAGSKK